MKILTLTNNNEVTTNFTQISSEMIEQVQAGRWFHFRRFVFLKTNETIPHYAVVGLNCFERMFLSIFNVNYFKNIFGSKKVSVIFDELSAKKTSDVSQPNLNPQPNLLRAVSYGMHTSIKTIEEFEKHSQRFKMLIEDRADQEGEGSVRNSDPNLYILNYFFLKKKINAFELKDIEPVLRYMVLTDKIVAYSNWDRASFYCLHLKSARKTNADKIFYTKNKLIEMDKYLSSLSLINTPSDFNEKEKELFEKLKEEINHYQYCFIRDGKKQVLRIKQYISSEDTKVVDELLNQKVIYAYAKNVEAKNLLLKLKADDVLDEDTAKYPITWKYA